MDELNKDLLKKIIAHELSKTPNAPQWLLKEVLDIFFDAWASHFPNDLALTEKFAKLMNWIIADKPIN